MAVDPMSFVSSLVVRLIGDRAALRHGVTRKLPWTSVRKISGRAQEIFSAASAGQCSIESAMAYVCERIPGLPLSAVEGIISGSAEVTVDHAKQICDALGASFDYLWRGIGAPFSRAEEFPASVNEYLPLFRGDGVEQVIFVRGNRMPHMGYVVLGYGEFEYRVLPHLWHISSENGNGGAKALSELARLSEHVHLSTCHRVVVSGIEVSPAVADGVFHGRLHPRSLWLKGWKPSHWWDDIADIDHKRACANKYASLYDDEFFAAQRLIKWVRSTTQ